MAMKLYYGDELVGGEVDRDDFDQLQTDVKDKYDKGDPSILDDDVMKYSNAALMEKAVLGNAGEIATLRNEIMETLIPALQEGGENIVAEFTKYFPIYGEDDQDALMYDNAAELGLAVSRNIQDIEANKTAITDGDADTLAAANKHSDDNDAVTLTAAKKYTDDEIAKIPDAEGIQEVEDQAVRNQNIIDGDTAPAGVMTIAVVDALPNSPSATTLYVVKG